MLTKKFCFMIFLKLYFKPVTVSIYQPYFTLDTLGLDLKPTQLTPWPNLPHPTLFSTVERMVNYLRILHQLLVHIIGVNKFKISLFYLPKKCS